MPLFVILFVYDMLSCPWNGCQMTSNCFTFSKIMQGSQSTITSTSTSSVFSTYLLSAVFDSPCFTIDYEQYSISVAKLEDFSLTWNVSYFITGPPTHSVGGRLVTVAGVCRRLSSMVVYNIPRRACRRLHPRRPGDDVMPPPV